MMGNPKPLSVAQVRLLLDITAGRPVSHHDATIIEALRRRGLVDRPRIDTNSKYILPALTALGRAEAEQRERRRL